jgi:nanoRNase/pAp phosphatase (c-di-AMP/oligoRNAs hydrolase)
MEYTQPKELKKVQELYNFVIHQKGKILLLTHNNPDPDGLASALALKYLLSDFWKFKTTVAYGGMIGRAENKAMVRNLNMDIKPVSEIRLRDYAIIALIDSQPGTGNNPLPENTVPDIVIDHHFPVDEDVISAHFIDIRPNCGSTSTILTEYLRDSGLTEIDRDVATALIYGIRSDTRDLGRESGPEDVAANNFLFRWVDFKLLSNIEHPRLSREYLRMFARAIERAVLDGNVVISDLQEISNTDSLSEVADLLVRLEGVKWAMCYGEFQGEVYFSLRMNSRQGHAGLLAQKIVSGIGSGGGHHMIAGGKISKEPVMSYQGKIEVLKGRFLQGINRVNFKGKPL